jgi:drug/metabolite transporter (DMT)-like permease
MGYLLFGEAPRALFYAASAIVVAGVAIVVWAAPAESEDPGGGA